MKNGILKETIAAAIALAMLTVRPVMASAAGDGVHLLIQSSPIVFTNADPGTCDPLTFAPKAGQPFCVLSATGTTNLSGDFVGTDLDEITILLYANGSSKFADYESWTGTVAGHGTGSFVLLETDGIMQADGSSTSRVRIVNGTGAGDLIGITGNGTFAGDTGAMTVAFPGQH